MQRLSIKCYSPPVTHSYSLDSVQTGSTALLAAAQEGHCSVVRMLLEAKADVNMKDNVSESCSSDGVCALAESSISCVWSVIMSWYKEFMVYVECTRVQCE